MLLDIILVLVVIVLIGVVGYGSYSFYQVCFGKWKEDYLEKQKQHKAFRDEVRGHQKDISESIRKKKDRF